MSSLMLKKLKEFHEKIKNMTPEELKAMIDESVLNHDLSEVEIQNYEKLGDYIKNGHWDEETLKKQRGG